MSLFAFGYNGWRQLIPDDDDASLSEGQTVKTPRRLPTTYHLLAASWEQVVYFCPASTPPVGELIWCGYTKTRATLQHVNVLTAKRIHLIGHCLLVLDATQQLWRINTKGQATRLLDKCLDVAVSVDTMVLLTHDHTLQAYPLATINWSQFVTSPHHPLPSELVSEVVAGYQHFLALTMRGEVLSWGSARFGQLGHGDVVDVAMPQVITSLQGLCVVKLACGAYHSAVITDAGDLYTFGWNQHGQLGVGEEDAGILHLVHFPSLDNDPTKDDNLLVSTVDVACGQAHTIAVREDGSVWSCGWGKYGQLGVASMEETSHFIRITLPPDTQRPTRCVCGPWTSFIITS